MPICCRRRRRRRRPVCHKKKLILELRSTGGSGKGEGEREGKGVCMYAYSKNRHCANNRRHDDEDGAAEEGHEGDFSADADADGPEELYNDYRLVPPRFVCRWWWWWWWL
jgi:hypothetical protein